jgi:hypothetical protein
VLAQRTAAGDDVPAFAREGDQAAPDQVSGAFQGHAEEIGDLLPAVQPVRGDLQIVEDRLRVGVRRVSIGAEH